MCKTNRKRTAYERQMGALVLKTGLCVRVHVMAGTNRQVGKLIRRGKSGKACAKCKTVGTKLRSI